jgi:hypothetical protein
MPGSPEMVGTCRFKGARGVRMFQNTIYFRRTQRAAFRVLQVSSFLPNQLSSFSKIKMFELMKF